MTEHYEYSLDTETAQRVFASLVIDRRCFDHLVKLSWKIFVLPCVSLALIIAYTVSSFLKLYEPPLLMRIIAGATGGLITLSLLYWFVLRPSVTRVRTAKYFGNLAQTSLFQGSDTIDCSVAADSLGITWERRKNGELASVHWPWKEIRSIEQIQSDLVVIHRSRAFVILPGDAMSSAEATRGRWANWIADSEPMADVEFAGAIAQASSSCPHCHYSLKGLTKGRCPECGRKLMLDRHGKVVEDDSPVAPAAVNSRPSAESR